MSDSDSVANYQDTLKKTDLGRLVICQWILGFIIKFRYNARSDWLEQRALSEYGCTE